MPAPLPRLASDAKRQFIASMTAPVVSFGYTLTYALTRGAAQTRADQLSVMVGSLFWAMTVYGIVYVAMTVLVLRRGRGEQLRQWLVRTDPDRNRNERRLQRLAGGGPTAYAITISVIAVAAVLILVQRPDLAHSWQVWVGAVGTVVSAWAVVMTAFAVRYSQLWANGEGLDYPGDGPDTFSDFLYVSIQLSTTFATSDVSVTTARARRLVSVHSVIAFAFNSVIVALLVSVVLSS